MTEHGPRQPSDLEDELLVVRCQLGERSAFDALIRRWHAPLRQYIRRMTGDDAATDDAVQEVWLRVLRGIARLREGTKLRAWLFGIARNVLMDRLRHKYAWPMAADVDLDEIAADDAPKHLEEELAVMLMALTRLPLAENEVLTLFYLQELSLGEVAQVLGIPVGTVKSRLFRARQLLRQEVARKGMTA